MKPYQGCLSAGVPIAPWGYVTGTQSPGNGIEYPKHTSG